MNLFSIIPSFLIIPLLAGLASSVTSGIIGSYVVTKRIVFISGSISHAVLGGMGLFLWAKKTYSLAFLSPIHGAILSSLVAAALLGLVHLKWKEREDSIIAAIWAAGMAIGVIFISFTPGYTTELMDFLFGNILWTSKKDLYTLLSLDGLVLALNFLFYRKFQAICFDEEQATLQGVSTKKIYLLLLCLIALTIVLLIQVVGAILVISLLTLPAATAGAYTKKLSGMMVLSSCLAAFFSLAGIFLSYLLNWPSGATITLFATGCYAFSLWQRKKHKHA